MGEHRGRRRYDREFKEGAIIGEEIAQITFMPYEGSVRPWKSIPVCAINNFTN